MRIPCKLIWITLAFGLLALAAQAAGEVSWDDEVTDPIGDVKDTGDNVVDIPGIDIVKVTMAEEGENVNVSMYLDGEYNHSASFQVNLDVDGEMTWSMSKVIIVGFMFTDPDQNMIDVDGFISADGKTLSWVAAKTDIDPSDSVSIAYGMTTYVDFGTFETSMDDTFPSGSTGEEADVKSVSITVDFEEITKMVMTNEMVYTGNGTADMRTSLDTDQDGTVTEGEVTAYEDQMMDFMKDPEINFTLDGKEPNMTTAEFSVEGAKGAADSKADITWVITMTATFPEPEEADTHTYA